MTCVLLVGKKHHILPQYIGERLFLNIMSLRELCKRKLRKECNLLEMSIGQSLIIVIGYELVSYLLHYSSVRCVTFKELFVCKSNNKTGD